LDELLTLANSWRRVLSEDPPNARPIVSSLLKGRVAFTPTSETDWWEAGGKGSFEQLFTRVLSTRGSVPNGIRKYVERAGEVLHAILTWCPLDLPPGRTADQHSL
jgi:hypothetical protein